jgi:hypothetical protein
VFGNWDDGGGVVDEVVGGAGDVNFSVLVTGDAEREADCNMAGVAGLDSSVEGISTDSGEGCDNGVCESILPRRKRDQGATDTSELQTGGALFAEGQYAVRRVPVVCATREGM